jgi:hypothetical protein
VPDAATTVGRVSGAGLGLGAAGVGVPVCDALGAGVTVAEPRGVAVGDPEGLADGEGVAGAAVVGAGVAAVADAGGAGRPSCPPGAWVWQAARRSAAIRAIRRRRTSLERIRRTTRSAFGYGCSRPAASASTKRMICHRCSSVSVSFHAGMPVPGTPLLIQ